MADLDRTECHTAAEECISSGKTDVWIFFVCFLHLLPSVDLMQITTGHHVMIQQH